MALCVLRLARPGPFALAQQQGERGGRHAGSGLVARARIACVPPTGISPRCTPTTSTGRFGSGSLRMPASHSATAERGGTDTRASGADLRTSRT